MQNSTVGGDTTLLRYVVADFSSAKSSSGYLVTMIVVHTAFSC